jgi:hypothetical protein
VVALALAAAAAGGAVASRAATFAGSPPAARPQLRLQWASMEYYRAGPADPLVELRIIVANYSRRPTDSTTILWEPAFAQQHLFVRSEPAPWRVRTDERGWGVLDTAGVLPEQHGTFRLWFAAGTLAVYEPRVVVVANGTDVIAETVAGATHRRYQVPSSAQRTFERGPLAALADAVRFLPSDGHGALPLAAAIGVLLSATAGAGTLAAFRVAGRQA